MTVANFAEKVPTYNKFLQHVDSCTAATTGSTSLMQLYYSDSAKQETSQKVFLAAGQK